MNIIDSENEAILELPVFHGFSMDIALIKKTVDINTENTILKFSDFFGCNVGFDIKRESVDKDGHMIFYGIEKDVYGKLSELKFYRNFGVNLWSFDLTPDDFLKRKDELIKEGWEVIILDKPFNDYNKEYKHEKSRTKMQKFFGLNKYKN